MEDTFARTCAEMHGVSQLHKLSPLGYKPKAGGNDLTATEHTKHMAGAGVGTLHVRSKVFREAPKTDNWRRRALVENWKILTWYTCSCIPDFRWEVEWIGTSVIGVVKCKREKIQQASFSAWTVFIWNKVVAHRPQSPVRRCPRRCMCSRSGCITLCQQRHD